MNPLRSLTLRSALLASGLLVLCGGLALGTAEAIANRWETAREQETMASLMELVAPSATAACFVGDATLADQVVRDLARTRGVRSATIQAGATPLARAGPAPGTPGGGATCSRKLWSPFNPSFQVGELTLIPDHRETLRQGTHIRRLLSLGLLGLSLVSALALILALHLLIARPMGEVVAALHAGGPESPVTPPRGHGEDELGHLVAGVNQRLDGLRKALEEGDQAREKLGADLRRQRAILDNAGPGIFVLRGDGTLEDWNLPFLQILGLEYAPPAPGAPLAPLFQAEHAQVQRCMARSLGESTPAEEVLRVRAPGPGGHHWYRLSLRPVGPDWFQGLLEPVSAHPADRLTRDPLTGTLNRLGAERAIAEALANTPEDLTLILVNLGFPDAPPALEPLREAARRITAQLGPASLLAHLDHQEFLVILRTPQEREHATELAARLAQELGRPFAMAGGDSAWCTASVGIARCDPGDEPGRAILLQRANQDLKNAARNSRSTL